MTNLPEESLTSADPVLSDEDGIASGRSLGFLVRKTHKAFTRVLESRLREYDISISMWFFLRLLWEKDGLSQKQCSDELNLTQPTTVSAMNILEKRGLIRRVRNEQDRRLVNVFLTDEGWSLRDEVIHFAAEVNGIAAAHLSSWEVDALRSLLVRVTGALEAEEQARAGQG